MLFAMGDTAKYDRINYIVKYMAPLPWMYLPFFVIATKDIVVVLKRDVTDSICTCVGFMPCSRHGYMSI